MVHDQGQPFTVRSRHIHAAFTLQGPTLCYDQVVLFLLGVAGCRTVYCPKINRTGFIQPGGAQTTYISVLVASTA